MVMAVSSDQISAAHPLLLGFYNSIIYSVFFNISVIRLHTNFSRLTESGNMRVVIIWATLFFSAA